MTPTEITSLARQLVPVLDAMELTVLAGAPGIVTVGLPAAPNRNDAAGSAYAGSLVAVAEAAGGLVPLLTLDVPGVVPVVASVAARFLRPGVGDLTASAVLPPALATRLRSDLRQRGRAGYRAEVAVLDSDGTTVAEVVAEYRLRVAEPTGPADG